MVVVDLSRRWYNPVKTCEEGSFARDDCGHFADPLMFVCFGDRHGRIQHPLSHQTKGKPNARRLCWRQHDIRNRDPERVSQLLSGTAWQNAGDKYHVSNFGFNGKTALDVNKNSFRKTNQYPLSLRYRPDIVIIMLGTNDTKPQNWVSQEKYKDDLRSLIQNYLELDSKPKVILCTPNSAYSTKGKTDGLYNYGINELCLKKECAAVKALVDEMQLDFIDMYKVTAGHSEWYRFDGIHPNKDGAKAIATSVYEKIIL